jgi:hypothetical protein
MKSSLDILREASRFSLNVNEEIVNTYTASYDAGSAGSSFWRLGNLYLTRERLLFIQANKVIFMIPLSEIIQLDLIKRRWIFGKRVMQLYIQWNNHKQIRHIFLAIKDEDIWKGQIETLLHERNVEENV